MTKVPSPCINVCKFKRAGHCIGCSMTKKQKSAFKKLKKSEHREAFVELVIAQQAVLGRYKHWQQAYKKQCHGKTASIAVINGNKAA